MMDAKPITLIDVYIRQLNEFDLFVLDRHKASGVDERRKTLFSFCRLFNNILLADQHIVNKTLRHFLSNISENIEVYIGSDPFKCLSTMKIKELPKDLDLKRFIAFVKFFIRMSENIDHIERYLSGCDLPYFFRDWDIPRREKLLNFFCDLKL